MLLPTYLTLVMWRHGSVIVYVCDNTLSKILVMFAIHLLRLLKFSSKCSSSIFHSLFLVIVFELESSLASLRYLTLSHNQLGPTSGSSLASLLSKCAGLTHLRLEDCGLTSYTLESHTGLTVALQGTAEVKYNTHDLTHTTFYCLSLRTLRSRWTFSSV